MNHDPLCWTYIKGLPDLTNPCDACAKIAMIRADEKAKWVIRPECDFSPDGRHGDFRFGPEKDLCGYCSEDVSRLFEMGQ